jgi:vacuolar protein sorting-associated protein 13B
MFKIESLLTPWLLGYLDEYIKFRPEDFKLSLWEGDIVFNKLDLRLEVIENLINVPITLKSGVINELNIHIPWTKVTSEPIVITINTLEFIATLKNDKNVKKDSKPSESFKNQSKPLLEEKIILETNVSTNYFQSIVNKILLNMNIVVNNLIIKLVEDDMVLSLNIKSVECYNVNSLWERAFLEVNTTYINLRKILQINDLTVCLDRRNASGKIEFYQDPFIYRCSVQARLHMIYKSISLKKPNNFFFQIYCKKLPISVTDQQLMMILRLVHQFNLLYEDSINAQSSTLYSNNNNNYNEALLNDDKVDLNIDILEESNDGWFSWAYSYLPSFTTIENEDEQFPKSNNLSANFAFYCDEISICLKVIF